MADEFDAVPDELKDRPQWLMWDASADTPRRPHWRGDFSVSWTNPDDWHTFDEAVQAAQERESWGIGYVNAVGLDDYPRGVYGGLDLDGCVTTSYKTDDTITCRCGESAYRYPDIEGKDENGNYYLCPSCGSQGRIEPANDSAEVDWLDGGVETARECLSEKYEFSRGPKDWLPDLTPFIDRGYLEYSPSGTGIHIHIAGLELPEWWSDPGVDEHEGVEAYDKKFFAVTGDQLKNSGSGAPDMGEWVTEWLKTAYENITGERPWDEPTGALESGRSVDAPSTTGNAREIARAVDQLDARKVAGKTIVDRWNDDSGDIWNFYPTWGGGDCRGTANIVDRDGWTDTGNLNGSGGPLEMAAIDLGELDNRGCEWGDADGQLWWDAVDHLRDMGFSIPEYQPARAASDGGTTTETGEPSGHTEEPDTPDEPEPKTPDWGTVTALLDDHEKRRARYQASEILLDRHHWRNLEENDKLYWYDPTTGVYHGNAKQKARTFIREGTSIFSRADVDEIQAHIRAMNTIPKEEMGGPKGKVAVENGVVDLADGRQLKDHDPKYNFLSRLNTPFDPDAECPTFREFLSDVVTSETDRKKLQEFAGYTLLHWALPYHKALFIVGPEASGKSTFLDTIRSLHGEEKVASLSPQQMTERFGGAELFDKWVNIRNDIPTAAVKNTGEFKEIVAGDPIKAEEKNKDPFMFKPRAKHMFAANQLPDTENDDAAFYRRILLVAFPHTIPRGERDTQLDEKLQRELPGVLNWALDGLERLGEEGRFTGDLSPTRTAEKWDKWGHTADRFARTCLAIGGSDASPIPKKTVYRVYQRFCEDENMPCDMQQAMTRRLKTEHGATDDRATVDGTQERCFLNVEFTSRGESYRDEGSDSRQAGL